MDGRREIRGKFATEILFHTTILPTPARWWEWSGNNGLWTPAAIVDIYAESEGIMPVILVLGPYRFFFYSNEGNPVKAPHIHVRSQNGEAKISLVEPYGVLLNAGFSAQELRKICKLVQEKQEILKGAYHDYFA